MKTFWDPEKAKSNYKKHGIHFEAGERVGIIIGASGLMLGLAKLRGMDGICLIGETIGRSMFTDTRAAKSVLAVISKMVKIKIDMADIDRRSHELAKAIVKAEEIEKTMLEKIKKDEELRYIA